MKKKLVTLSFLLLVGCSTEPVLPQNAKEVQPSSEFQKKADTTAVTIIRDKGFVSGGCVLHLILTESA